MGYCSEDCGDNEHPCTAWDGTGKSRIEIGEPNHNLVEKCPDDIKTCTYRHKKVKSSVKV